MSEVDHAARLERVLELLAAGVSYREIGLKVGLSRARVGQIIAPHLPPRAPLKPGEVYRPYGRFWNGSIKGDGWGGPAKGNGNNLTMKQPFEAGNAGGPGNNTDAQIVARATRDSMMRVYERIAEDRDQPGATQCMAADKWFDRKEGRAVARVVSLSQNDVTMLDDAALNLIALGPKESAA